MKSWKDDVISFVVGIALAILIVALAFNVWAADASGADMVLPQETLTMSSTSGVATPFATVTLQPWPPVKQHELYLPIVMGGGE